MEYLRFLSSMAMLFAWAVILIGAWKLFNWVWLRPKTLERCLRQQGLSGNPYRLLFGDTKDSARMHREAMSKPIGFANDHSLRVLPFLHHTIETYGKNSFYWSGPVPIVMITDPELIREVFTKYNDFQKPKLHPLAGLLAPGTLKYEGEKWAMHRKLLNPAFHMEKLKLMMPAFYASCDHMVSKWEEIVSETSSRELDVWSDLTTLTADVISRAAFGSSYEEGRRIFQLLREQTNLVAQFVQSVYIPGWRYVPTRANRKMKELNREIQSILREMIYRRKKEMEAGEAAKDDLLGLLLESSFEEVGNHGHGKYSVAMTVEELINECKLFYFAGQETTSALLVWTMIMLGKHQDWQAQAREEVLKTFGNDKPNFDGLNHLKIVTMILHEVLRLYPPVVQNLRRLHHNISLGKLSLPAGVYVRLPILLVQQDPELWGEDAKEFKPERFSEGILKASNGKNSYFPFAWGPRICIGQNFAMTEAKLALSMILQRFSFELSPSYTHAPLNAPLLQPQHGAHLILHQL
ncbi:hypothetical protein Ancab_040167 [Ancistrocladus abbreviatus]